MVLDGVLYLRRQCLGIGFGLVEGLEIKDRRQHLAHLLSRQLGHVLIEVKRHHGSFCIQVLGSGPWRCRGTAHAHLNVLIPLLTFLRSAVNLHHDCLVFDHYVADDDAIAGSGRVRSRRSSAPPARRSG